ncbi:MAG: fimbrillin family protein, partial [Alistipes sp.]|nr:fimbrillin family protein [Alistipes sp.]
MKKTILSLVMAAGALTSCQTTDETASAPGKVAIAPVITRATEVNFEAGDRIGLTIVKGGAAYADNSLLTFTGNVFTGELTWYDEALESSTLMAYYPYDTAGTPTSFTVAADQSGAGYGASDLMASVKSGVAPSASAVSMVFKHMLTKIVVDITNETGAGIAAVTLKNSVPTADFDLATLTVAADASAAAADIKAQSVVDDKTYRAIMIPQTAALTLAVELENGKVLSQKLAEAALAAGGQYTV